MILGFPKEIKASEERVSITPAGVEELNLDGHDVLIETRAGEGSGFSDDEFAKCGGRIVTTAREVWETDCVVKVKEPLPQEWPLLREDQLIVTYLHCAGNEKLTQALVDSGTTAIAYETIKDARGTLPLLAPMSEIAGQLSVPLGAMCLQRVSGGRGVLIGRVPGVPPANVAILGGGSVGTNAAIVAAGSGANVFILEIDPHRLRRLAEIMPPNVTTLVANRHNVRECLRRAELVIGAVLTPGGKAPHIVRFDDLKTMLPGSVIVDVAIDQGGCVETSKATTHRQPTFVVENIVHYCVPNIPAAVSRTATVALTDATLPYIKLLASKGLARMMQDDPGFAEGVNVRQGKVTNAAVARTFGLDWEPCRLPVVA